HDDVRDLRSASTHGRERLVARRVEERDEPSARQCDVVRADVLRNAASLAGDDVRFADVVEERRLPMVDVAHDSNDRRPRLEVLGFVRFDPLPGVRGVLLLADGLEPELTGDQFDLIEIESLVDRDHQTQVLERESDDLRRWDLEDLRKLADGDEFVDVNGLPLALTIRLALRLLLLAK